MNVREVQKEDAAQLVALFDKLDNETHFMLFEPGERKLTIEQQVVHIDKLISSVSHIMFVAVNMEDKIVGFVVGIGGIANRSKHVLQCVVGVEHAFTGQGIGKTLMKRLVNFANEHGFSRMELTVMEHNEIAKNLYSSLGFELEGVKRNALYVEGHFINELYMSKIL